MRYWITNAKALREEVVVPFREVIWHVSHWKIWQNNGVVLFGDDTALFIFDPRGKKLHCIVGYTYLCHEITRFNLADWGDDCVSRFYVKMTDATMIRLMSDLSSEEKKEVRRLADTCERSKRWLAQHDPN